MRSSLKALLFCLALAFSCSNPASRETFIKASETEVPGRYSFSVDFSDSLAVYDLDIYTMADINRGEKVGWTDIQAYSLWTSPSGKQYSETFVMPDSAFVRKTFNSYHYLRAYRHDVSPKEAGLWTVEIILPVCDQTSMVRGLGLIVTRK